MKQPFGTQNHLVLVDGYSFLFRAYHSMPPLTNSQGLVIGAALGYSNMILKLKKTLNASHLGVIFDHKDKSFRNQIYSAYKANRPPAPEDLIPQFDLIREFTTAISIKSLEKSGYEADDIIATLSKRATAANIDVTIISSDKDLTQLVTDRVRIYDPMKQKIIDAAAIHEKYGVYPEQMLDFLSLTGDSADNIPGVPSIGPKTAAELLNRFGSLEGIFDNIAEIKQPKRRDTLANNQDNAFLSKKLITLAEEVAFELNFDDFLMAELELEKIIPFLKKYEFNAILKKLNYQHTTENNIIAPKKDVIKIQTISELKEIILKLGLYAKILIEVTENKFFFATEQNIFWGEIVSRETSLLSSNISQIEPIDLINNLNDILYDNTILKIFPDFKRYYRNFLTKRNNHQLNSDFPISKLCSIHDISVTEYLLPKDKRFKTIADEKLDAEISSDYIIKLYNHYNYALRDIIAIQQFTLLHDIDLPLNNLLLEMENNGFKLDQGKLLELTEAFSLEIKKLEEKIYDISGAEFNIASPKQLGEILFNKLALNSSKKSKKTKSLSTSGEVLEELAANGHEIANLILQWRHFSKLKNTYTEALPKLIKQDTSRIHSHFANNSTTTGRLSSHNPNLQNIPIRSKEGDLIREAFICDKDNILISADYSQIELRLLAHYAKVHKLQNAFKENQDIHSITASEVFNISLDQIDDEYRRRAKTINFGIIYGISGFGLANRLSISRKEAQEYIDLYFSRYPEIKAYMHNIVADCKTQGFVETLLQRKLFFPELNNAAPAMQGFLNRAIINAPLQGSAADIIKKAMLDIDHIIKSKNLPFKLLLQVHDELIYELPKSYEEQAIELIKTSMENVMKLDVPLEVSINSGLNWKDIH